MNPRKVLEAKLRDQVDPDRKLSGTLKNRPKIELVEDGYTSGDSDTNNNPNV